MCGKNFFRIIMKRPFILWYKNLFFYLCSNYYRLNLLEILFFLEKEISRGTFNIIAKYGELISAYVINEEHYNKTKNYSFLTNVMKNGILIG